MQEKITLRILFVLVLFSFVNKVVAQPAWTFNLLDSTKRAKKFEDRKLGSEKMSEKKFTIVRRIFQDNFTHYNYFYNANNKINSVIERAKIAQKDDYTKLLSYYGYSLQNTALQKTELDSVIYKATAGILLHDLRNDWIDNMYLLMGEAYFYKKDFDSAAATFQFINYNLFPRKKDEDDSRIVGTRDDDTPAGTVSIANKEKQNILQKLTALPPSRNDALIWMIHTLIEQSEFGDAASLINTLQHDPNLPVRLTDDLEEVTAYWFFKQNMYDSTTIHLENALSNAPTKQDRARSQFLLAQLYEITHKFDKATEFYNKSSLNTTDPLMDIYAQLNNAKMMKVTDSVQMEKSILNLAHMAKKDKFEQYRDIIYYSAGDLSLQKPDSNEAVFYYKKSLKNNINNIRFKNKAFLQLADIAYNRKEYKMAYNMYDSLQSGDSSLADQITKLQDRKKSLAKIVEKIDIINREDSLQKLAAMPDAERVAYITKLSKKRKKEQGLKDSDNNVDDNGSPMSFDSKKNGASDLFSSDNKGGWYFYNTSAKNNGASDFKRKWGTRTNTDNWARKSAIVTTNNGLSTLPDIGSNDLDALPGVNKPTAANTNVTAKQQDISFDGLMAAIPKTPEKILESNTLIATSDFDLALLYQTELEDYQQAIFTYDNCLKRYPDSLHDGAIYLGLYYCYNKLGNTQKAAYYKNLVNTKFADSHSSNLLNNTLAAKSSAKNAEGTKRYSEIYNLFIEGNFSDALSQKQKADSLYGKSFWSPQLLYIEAVYHIKQHNDSTAIAVLSDINSLYPTSALAPKAVRMIDVLKRRKEIEKYLTDLQVTRATDDEVIAPPRVKLVRNDSNLIVSPKQYFDTSKSIIPKAIPVTAGVFKDPLKKIIPTTPATLPVEVANTVKDTTKKITPVVPKKLSIVVNTNKDSSKSVAIAPVKLPRVPVKKAHPVKVDSSLIVSNQQDSIKKVAVATVIKPVVKDSINQSPTSSKIGKFTFNTTDEQYVVMVLDKVDGTYVNESKNAFDRYVKENFKDQAIEIVKDGLDKNTSLLLFARFVNAEVAIQFLTKIRKAAPDEVSWLPAAKYFFIIVSNSNLEILFTDKNLIDYKSALSKQYPGKF